MRWPAPPPGAEPATPADKAMGRAPGWASVPEGNRPAATGGCTRLRTMRGVTSKTISVRSMLSLRLPNKRPATGN